MNIEQYAFPELEPGDQDWRWCHRYAYDIIRGEVPSCQKMKWAALRHFRDLENPDFYFDEEAAKSIVLWFKFIPITDGKNAGSPTILLPWQIFVVVSLIAWKWNKDTFDSDGNALTVKGNRRFNQTFILISRKGGKTTLAAGIMLYLMYKSGYQPRAYAVATKRDQAKLLWKTAALMIKLSPRLRSIFDVRANEILMPNVSGEFKALASDSHKMDGLNPIAVSLDELHSYKDRNLYGVMISAFGAQPEYLLIGITTAGFVLDGLAVELYKNGERVLNPDDPTTQDNYFYVIYEIDKDDDWSDSKNWYKSNPGLIYGLPNMKYLTDRFQEAVMSVAEKANFLTKHLNQFVNSSDVWLDVVEVKSNRKPGLDIEKFRGRKAWVGIDRAMVHDLTSFSVLIPDDVGGVDVFWVNLLPKKTVDAAGDYLKSLYHKAVDSGDLRLVMTPTVRDDDIKKVMTELSLMFEIEAFCYDPYHMADIASDMEAAGFTMLSVSQGTGNMSLPAKKLEGLIKEKQLRYDSGLFEFACSCALITMTRQNNLMVYRENSKTDKIDPLIATIIALSAATLGKVEKSVYDDRDILIF